MSRCPGPVLVKGGSARERFQAIRECFDLDSLLFGGVALADRHRLVLQSLEVDRDAERGADLVLAAIAPADVAARLVVLDPKLAAQRFHDLLRRTDELGFL